VFKETIRLRPSQLTAHNGLGSALAEVGRHQEAIPEFQCVIRELRPSKKQVDDKDLDGRYVNAMLALPKSLLCVGRFAEGQEAAQAALGLPSLDELRRAILERQLEICRTLAPLANERLSGGSRQTTLPRKWCSQSGSINTGDRRRRPHAFTTWHSPRSLRSLTIGTPCIAITRPARPLWGGAGSGGMRANTTTSKRPSCATAPCNG